MQAIWLARECIYEICHHSQFPLFVRLVSRGNQANMLGASRRPLQINVNKKRQSSEVHLLGSTSLMQYF